MKGTAARAAAEAVDCAVGARLFLSARDTGEYSA